MSKKLKKQLKTEHKKKVARCRKRYNRKYKRLQRKNELFKNKENLTTRDRIKKIRAEGNYSLTENKKNLLRSKLLLQNKVYKLYNNFKNSNRISIRRLNADFKLNESKSNVNRNKLLRTSSNYKKLENFKNSLRNKRLREDNDYKLNENDLNIKRNKILRKSKCCTERQNNSNKCYKQKFKEEIRCQNKLKKREGRFNEIIHYRTNLTNKLYVDSEKGSKLSELLLSFIENRNNGPDITCTCCDNLFFRKSVEKINFKKMKLKLSSFESINIDEFLNKVINVSSEFICKTCLSYILKGKIPETTAIESIKFPDVLLIVKNLTLLEERMVFHVSLS